MRKKVFIIAETGINHNGSLRLAKRLIDAAVSAGADAVKFQTFRAESLATRYAPKASYQKKSAPNTQTQLEMLKKLELSASAHRDLIKYCRKKKIIFISSPFDLCSISLLASLKLSIFKIPSGEITNLPYLRKIGSLHKKIILSTGMATLNEIKDALNILVSSGTRKNNISLLHCTTEYPAPVNEVNLNAMRTLKDKFGVRAGYSDHTIGIEVSIAAAALGADVIEKHLTLDKKMRGPDHKASLEPDELKKMIGAIRSIEIALGDGIKRPTRSELKNAPAARKSIVALSTIRKGERFTENNITVKRPGNGINPMKWDKIIGKPAKEAYQKDELIRI